MTIFNGGILSEREGVELVGGFAITAGGIVLKNRSMEGLHLLLVA
jgi:hypothetical protein